MTKKELIAENESLKKEIKHLKEIRQRDYKYIVEKFEEAESAIKRCSNTKNKKDRERKKLLLEYREGLIYGLIALDDNLKSTVMKG